MPSLTPYMLYIKLAIVGAVVLVVTGLGVDIYIKNLKIDKLTANIVQRDSQIKELNQAISIQNQAILANKIDYEERLNQLPKEITKIQTKYQTIYKTIDAIKEDKNATCENAISDLNTFVY